MSFQDLEDFLDTSLRLPVKGKTYVVPPPSIATGVWCTQLLETAAKAQGLKDGEELPDADVEALMLDDDEEKNLYKRILGPVYQELVDDNVEWPYLTHMGQTVFFWITADKARAEKFWKSGGRGKAPKAPTDRKPKKGGAKSGRRASAAGTTPSPSSETVSPGGSSSPTGT